MKIIINNKFNNKIKKIKSQTSKKRIIKNNKIKKHNKMKRKNKLNVRFQVVKMKKIK